MNQFTFDDLLIDEIPENCVMALVIYDIVSNKGRTRFSKFMSGYGVRVQKSAFEVKISNSKFREMIDRIPKMITDKDNVRVYKIFENNQIYSWGRSNEIEDDSVILI